MNYYIYKGDENKIMYEHKDVHKFQNKRKHHCLMAGLGITEAKNGWWRSHKNWS